VLKRPDAIALVFDDDEMSYAELNVRANRLAYYLRELGVRPDDRVAICTEHSSFEMIVAFLAVLKAGGAYVPLDPSSPKERLCYLLGDCAPVALLTQGHIGELFSELSGTIPMIEMGTESPAWKDGPDTNPDAIELTPNHLAYVIYTSGSTGQPKGVMVQHSGIVRLVNNTDYVQLASHDVVAQASNVSFDAATFEIWGALLAGARLVNIDKDALLSPTDLTKNIQKSKITTLFLTTALFNHIACDEAEAFTNLRYLLFGGERVEPQWVARVLSEAKIAHLLHVYGPTETTTFASWHEVTTIEPNNTIPIGRPIANTRIYILDAHGQPTPTGVSGELYIGGEGVARGYLNCPELTGEKFLADPFAAEPDARMYRTGDLGRWLPDGIIEFQGRNDFQVKLRGFRIELGEIESRLIEHPAVREVVVLAREDAPGEKRLVAYYTGTEDVDKVGTEQLRAHLASLLPEYMLPAAFVCLDSLPLTPNGKLDRKALPAPETGAFATRDYEAPNGAVEEALAEIWEQLLGLERVGRQDNFFELGGHSLLAVRLIERMRQRLGLEMSISDIFVHQQLFTLAGNVASMRGKDVYGSDCAVPIRLGISLRPLFLVHDGNGSVLYTWSLASRLDRDISVYALPPQPAKEEQLQSIEAMAQRMVQMIRLVQPNGPYRIGGYSFGGIVAYEISSQLLAIEQQVELLALFDSSLPSTPAIETTALEPKLQFLQILEDRYFDNEPIKMELKSIHNIAESMTFGDVINLCRSKHILPDDISHLSHNEVELFMMRTFSSRNSLFTYIPMPIDASIHLFVSIGDETSHDDHISSKSETSSQAAQVLWRALAPIGQLKTYRISGTHYSMMKSPNVDMLGSILVDVIHSFPGNASPDQANNIEERHRRMV